METKEIIKKIIELSTNKKEAEDLLESLQQQIENDIIADSVYILRNKDVVSEYKDTDRLQSIYSSYGETMFYTAGIKLIAANSTTLGGLLATITQNTEKLKTDKDFEFGYELITSVLKHIGIIYENGENLSMVADIMNNYLMKEVSKSEKLTPVTADDEIKNEEFKQTILILEEEAKHLKNG